MKNPKRNLLILTVILVIGAAAAGAAVLRLRQTSLGAGQVAYDTFTVRRMDLSDKIDATGDVITEKNAAIYPPYNATVKEILVKPGDTVHKGDILLKLQLKDADLINYMSGWKSSLEQAQSNLATAQKALKREQILFKAQGTTIDEVETQQSKVWQYETEISEYRQKLASLTKNGVDNNNDILIKAPFDAEVSWIDVKLEESVTTSTELLTLGGNSAIRIEASVDQGDIDQIKVGLPATIKANDQNRTEIQGIVTSFGRTGTTTSNVVTFPVVIKPLGAETTTRIGQGNRSETSGFMKKGTGLRRPRINPTASNGSQGAATAPGGSNADMTKLPLPGGPNSGVMKMPSATGQNSAPPHPAATASSTVTETSDSSISLLKAGMTVDVSIMADSHANVLAVPLTAVTEQGGRSTVKVLTDSQTGKEPVAKTVQLGYKSTLFAEVLSGLAEGDQVILPKVDSAAGPNGNFGSKRQGGMMGGPMGPPMR